MFSGAIASPAKGSYRLLARFQVPEMDSLMSEPVLIRVMMAGMKHQDQKQLAGVGVGVIRLILPQHCSPWKEVRMGTVFKMLGHASGEDLSSNSHNPHTS